MFFKVQPKSVGFVIIIILAFLTRFYGLAWGGGFFFHPDENNMATALSGFSLDSLDPKFYAYGQFPLYLGYFLLNLFGIPNTFSASVYILRLISAFASMLTIFVFKGIWHHIFPKSSPLCFLLLLVFTPGLIQIAHFGTTESLLVLLFSLTLYLALKIYINPQLKQNYLYYCLVLAFSLATKVSALIFLTPLLIALLPKLSIKALSSFLFYFLTIILVTFSSVTLSLFFSPASFLNLNQFLSSMNYETGVASGRIPVFYTRQFEGTTPYLFQLTHVFPYVWGLPLMVGFVAGLILIIKNFQTFKKLRPMVIILGLSVLIYFAYFGQLYTKWIRFQAPIFFIGPFFAAYFIIRLNNYLKAALLTLFVISGVLFFTTYLYPDVRLQASQWLVNNIKPTSKVLSESGNVVNLPLLAHSFPVINFDFYQLDTNPELASEFRATLDQVDVILVPSRRVYKNQNNPRYPVSRSHYDDLFSGRSGYKLIKTFTLNNYFILNPENAEETFTVFDQPTIRVYQKK